MLSYTPRRRALFIGASLGAVLWIVGSASIAAAATISFHTAPSISLGGISGSLTVDESTNTVYLRNSTFDTFSAIDGDKRVVSGQTGVDKAPAGVAIDAGRKLAVIATRSGLIDFVDTRTMTPSGSPILLGGEPTSVAIDPAGGFAYVVTPKNDAVSVIDLDSRTVVGAPITVGKNPKAIALDTRAGVVLVTNSGDATVSAIGMSSRKVIGGPSAVGARPLGIAIDTARGLAYVSSNDDGTVTVIRVFDNVPLGSFSNVGLNPQSVAVDPITGRIFVGSHADSTVTVINPDTRTPVDIVKTGLQPISVAFDSLHHVLYTANENDGTVSVIDEALSPSLADVAPPGCSIGDHYSFQFTAEGYPLPQFELGSGELPPGLSLSPGGLLDGTCGHAGTSTFSIVARNGASPDATAEFRLVVSGTPTTSTTSPPNDGKTEPSSSRGGSELAQTGGRELTISLIAFVITCCGALGVVVRKSRSLRLWRPEPFTGVQRRVGGGASGSGGRSGRSGS